MTAYDNALGVADRASLLIMGGPVLYRPEFDDPVTVRGTFWREYRRQDPGDPGVASVSPAVWFLLSDLKRANGTTIDPTADRAVITVDGVEYRVREPLPDHQGGILLFLQRV